MITNEILRDKHLWSMESCVLGISASHFLHVTGCTTWNNIRDNLDIKYFRLSLKVDQFHRWYGFTQHRMSNEEYIFCFEMIDDFGRIYLKKFEKYPTLGVRGMNLTIGESKSVLSSEVDELEKVGSESLSSRIRAQKDMIRTVILTLRRSNLDSWRRRYVSAGSVLCYLMGTSSTKTRHSIESRIGYASVKVPLTNLYLHKYK